MVVTRACREEEKESCCVMGIVGGVLVHRTCQIICDPGLRGQGPCLPHHLPLVKQPSLSTYYVPGILWEPGTQQSLSSPITQMTF